MDFGANSGFDKPSAGDEIQLPVPQAVLANNSNSWAAIALSMDSKGTVVNTIPSPMKGFMLKQGHLVHNWKTRFFVLSANKLLKTSNLNWYDSSKTLGISEPSSDRYSIQDSLFAVSSLGSINLKGYSVVVNPHVMDSSSGGATVQVALIGAERNLILGFPQNSSGNQQMAEWVTAFNNHIAYSNSPALYRSPSAGSNIGISDNNLSNSNSSSIGSDPSSRPSTGQGSSGVASTTVDSHNSAKKMTTLVRSSSLGASALSVSTGIDSSKSTSASITPPIPSLMKSVSFPSRGPTIPPMRLDYILKQGAFVRSWKKRFFVLLANNISSDLSWFESHTAEKAEPYGQGLLGSINLKGYSISEEPGQGTRVRVVPKQGDSNERVLVLDFEKRDLRMEYWVVALRSHVAYANRLTPSHVS